MADAQPGDETTKDPGEGIGRVQADHGSTAIGNIHIGRDLSGSFTIGYTAEQVSVLLSQITTNFQPKPFSGECPYKGLEAFQEEDAGLFFGRERLVEELVGRVKDSRAVFITGPSGSGKSSLVRAGLIHALKEGAIKSSKGWLYETMKPGREPLKALALAFSRLKGPELADYFQAHAAETEILHKCAESALSGRADQRLVLFVDQFEEVFTQVNAEAEGQAFLNMLAHAGTVENGRVIVLFAMRSDFVSNCAAYPAVNELLSRQFRQIGSMGPEELVSAIALPAKKVGLPVEPELIAQIINDMKGEPGALPLMQFALKELFEARQAKGRDIALTLEDYLERGGIQKMLARHADATLSELSPQQQELARSVFGGLIEIGRGRQDTRRTALFKELVPANTSAGDVEAVVQKLADARLVITDEQAGQDTVTIAHERLISAWPWLEKLIDENRDAIALQNEIAGDAKEWDDHGRDPSYLYTGARLANAREKLEGNKILLSGLAEEFVIAGQAQERHSQRTRVLGVAIPISLVILAIIVVAFLVNANTADAAKRSGEFAKTQQASAVTSEALAALAQANAEEAQKQTNNALARQLAAQAQSIIASRSSRQMVAILLAIQSMELFPTGEAASFLLNDNLAAPPFSRMIHDDVVGSVAFSPDGRYVVSGSNDHTARVWEATTGKEVARMTHDDVVNSVAFSPDGRYVVSGSDDHTVRVWEAATGKEVAHMTHESYVESVAFSPDGRYVVSGSYDHTVRVWEAATGKEVARMTHESDVSSVAFSPDGRYVVSGSNDHTARVWEATTGKEVARMTHESIVYSVAFSPDGRYVVSGSDDHTVRVWEAATGKEVAHMTHEDAVISVAFSRDGKYVVSGSWDKTARVWEAATGKEVARMTQDDRVYRVAFSQDGRYVVSGSLDGTACVWEALTGREVARMTHDGAVSSVAFSPDSEYVVSGSVDHTARLWEATTGKEVARMTHEGHVISVAFSLDSKQMVSGSFDGTARILEITTRKEVARMTHEGHVSSVAFSPDGKYVASGDDNGTARVWEAATGKEVARMRHDFAVYSVAFSPDSKYIVSGSLDHTARVWEAATGKEVARMIHEETVYSVAFSPDGRYVVSGSQDLTARVWEAATGKEVARMTHDDAIYSVAFSPNSKYVVSGSFDGTARVWETANGKEVARMTHEGPVISVAFSPDGRYVVSGGGDHTARVWEATNGKEVARMIHEETVYSVAFSPDGKYVVSGSFDDTARVWETATGKEVARMTHEDDVYFVAFSPDGRYVVSGSNDHTVRVWYWKPDDLIANACRVMPRSLTRAEWKQYIGDALPYQAVCPNLPIEPEVMATLAASPTP